MKKLMIGNAAVARGAYEAGCRLVASYPGTPSTEITESVIQYDEIYAEWAPNEKVAAEVALGAAVGGGRAMTCAKHVGLNVMADPVFTASYTGINGGLVICIADDPGMHSSQNEQDSRHYAKAAKIMMLEPSDSAECKEFTKLAFDLSEKFDTPVFLRLSTRVAHSQSFVELEDRTNDEIKPYVKDPAKYVMNPGFGMAKHFVVEDRIKKQTEYAETSGINKIESSNKKIGVITSGISYLYAKEALGDKVDFLKLGIVYPLPEKLIRDFASSHEIVFVIEELDGYIEEHCKALGINVCGKELFSYIGEYTPSMIAKAVLNADDTPVKTPDESLPVRSPVMCPGCPHRGAFYTLKKLGLTVCGDIGCYTLGGTHPLSSVDTTVCMGASIGMAHGMVKVRGNDFAKKSVAVIGDSTFIHSGITGLIDVVYNKGVSTVLILDNSTTGMTGHQDNPTTGKTIRGEIAPIVNIELLCKAIGINRVRTVDPCDLDEFEKAVSEEIQSEEVSVIVAKRPCALLKTTKLSGRCIITDQCKNCKKCMGIGCPAISIKNGKVTIDGSMCVGCELCAKVCPFKAITKEDK